MKLLRRSVLGLPLWMVILLSFAIVAAAILYFFTIGFQGSIFAPDMTAYEAWTNDDNDPLNTVFVNTGLDPSGPLDTLGPGSVWPDHGYDFASCVATLVGGDVTVDMTNAYDGYHCGLLVRFDNNSAEDMDLIGITVDGGGTAPVSISQAPACGTVVALAASAATVKFGMAVDPGALPISWSGESISLEWGVSGTYVCP